MLESRSLALALSLLAALLPAQDSKPEKEKAPPPAARKLALAGAYFDLAEAGLDFTALLTGGGAQPKSFYDFVQKLEGLAKSEDARPILVDLSQGVGLNLVQIAELERAFAKLRAAGKKTTAYLEGADLARYQLATLCDRILLADMGGIDLRSLSLSVTFMKDALDLLGVQMDVVRCGDFKGAVEPYMLSQMSDHLRAHYRDMVEHMNADVVRRIAARRGLGEDAIRKLQQTRILGAQEALAHKLVDALVPWDGAERALRTNLQDAKLAFDDALGGKKKRQAVNPLSMLTDMLNPKQEKKLSEDSLVVLHLAGAIEDGEKAKGGAIVSGPVVKTIEDLTNNEHVKGVVLRVNSPGGSATASEAILLALKRLAAKKPVAVSMGYVAASGGYYVTCFGRPIFAEEGTITGSIGVFGMRPNLGALMRRVGIREEIVGLDASAEFEAIDRPWTESMKATIQKRVDEVYERFVAHVAASRGISKESVLAIAGGRVWAGRQAVANKLVDHIGGLDAALALVAKESGVAADKVVHLPKPKSPLDALLSSLGDDDEVAIPGLDRGLTHELAQRFPVIRELVSLLRAELRDPTPVRIQARMLQDLVVR